AGASAQASGGQEEEQQRPMATVERLEQVLPMPKKLHMIMEERNRVKRLKALEKEMTGDGKELELWCAAVIERLPVVLPDVEDWEADMLLLKREKEEYTKKLLPRKNLNVTRNEVRRDELWAWDLLKRGNDKLGPLAYDKDIEAKIEEQKAKLRKLSTEKMDEIMSRDRPTDIEKHEDELNTHLERVDQLMKSEGMSMEEAMKRVQAEDDGTADVFDANLDDLDVDIDDDDTDEVRFELVEKTSSDAEGFDAATFVPEPRVTEDDENNNLRSFRRNLSRRLHLIVKVADPAGGPEPVWRFPMGPREVGEPMYQSAARNAMAQISTSEEKDEQLELYMVSKCTVGWDIHPFSPEKQQETGKAGIKMFLYRGQRISGELSFSKDVLDHAWVANDELHQIVPNFKEDAYWKYAHQFMDD
ncbi:39S ribosomal protein L46, partial [Durusdinium trenchii]